MHPVTAHQFLFGRNTNQATIANLKIASRRMPKHPSTKSSWEAFFRVRKSQ